MQPNATDTKPSNFLNEENVKQCLQEKLEDLVSPNAKSLHLFIECPQVPKTKKPKPKEFVVEVLDQYAPYNIYIYALHFTDIWNLDSNYWIIPHLIRTMRVCAQLMCPRVALQNG